MALTRDETHFLLRRLHSLSGIIPIGGYLLFHLFENASARHGPEAFNLTVQKIGEIPYLYAIEILVLVVPILFHGIYGLFIASAAKPNVVHYPFGRNWAYFMQRFTGIMAFIYIGYHVYTTRYWSLFVKRETFTFADMSASLSNPGIFAFYIVGILACVYHLGNGIWSFSITWGLVQTEKMQKRLAAACMIFTVIVSIVGIDILTAFTGGSFLSRLSAAVF